MIKDVCNLNFSNKIAKFENSCNICSVLGFGDPLNSNKVAKKKKNDLTSPFRVPRFNRLIASVWQCQRKKKNLLPMEGIYLFLAKICLANMIKRKKLIKQKLQACWKIPLTS